MMLIVLFDFNFEFKTAKNSLSTGSKHTQLTAHISAYRPSSGLCVHTSMIGATPAPYLAPICYCINCQLSLGLLLPTSLSVFN